MKKKILTILMTILTACMLMFTLSACGDKTPQITGITVSGQAEVYIDEFDYADYTITATYDNGTTENVTLQAEHLSAEDNATISTVGTHTLTVTYSGKTATLSLTVKNHDFDGVTFDNKTVVYNGLPQTIEVLGLPSGANVTYAPNNTYTQVGEYPVTATITKQYYNDLQLTATLKITDIIRKITFVQAGVEDIVKEVVDGGTLSENEIPTPQEVNGYEVKWNRTEFSNITSDITVEIEKTLKTYHITYVLNGGTNHIDNPEEFTIESPNLALYTPEKAIGATFAGWYTNSAFTDESKITEIKHGSYGDKTVYAKWLDYRIENADGFTINYNQQPALVSMTVPYTTENIDLNSRFTVSKGCTWKLYSDFMGNYEFPLKAMTLSVGENKAYIIVFHPDGEHFTRYLLNIYRLDMKEYAFMNGLSVWKDGEIQERSELSAPTTNPEKTGYTFGGWAVDGNKVEFPYTVTEDVIFTAIFIPIEYDIVYNLNNGELNTNKTKYTIEQYFTFDTPTRDYYDFSGWFNNANFDGNAITGVSIGTYGKINLFAKWTPIDYVIDYEENGGTNDDNNPTEYNVETETITLKNPTKDGYTFIGWYKESTFNTKVTQIVKGSHGNIKLYAKWTENVNGLNFDGNGNTSGSMTAIALKTGETKAIPLNTFVKTGYTFRGWSTSTNGSVVYNDGANYTMGTNSQYTLYAVWKANLNTLTFNGNGANGGSTSSMQLRTDSSKPLNTNGFTRTKYLFAGWAETANGAVKHTDGATYTMGTNASYTLYAIWTLNENEITFNGNGNTSGSMPNQTVYNNGNKVLNDNAFVKTGYHFIGWAESADGAVKYIDGATAIFVQKENYTLYAKWEANLNTLTFNGNGNTGGSTNSMQIRSDASATLNQNGFTKTGYTFKGWSTSKNGEVEYLNGASYTMGLNASYTLYAVWEENVNGLNFDGNGNTSGTMTAIALKTGETKAIPLSTFVKAGYHFIGWAESKNGEVVYNDGANYTMGTNSSYTLYAVWEENVNGLYFDGNGNTCGSMTAIELKTGETKTIPSNAFVKTGYTFKGWATSANGSIVYNDGVNYTMGTASQYTLYAVWEANLNTLTFNGNGATGGSTNSMQIRSDATVTLNSNGFTRTKYLFAGWAETANGAVKYTDGTTYTMGTNASYTLYAVWTLNENEITFNGNGSTSGSMPNQIVYNNGNKVLNDNAFVKTGYHFIGWAETSDGEVKYTEGATVTFVQKENYILYAKWEANLNTIFFDGNGASTGEMESIQAKTGETIILPSNLFYLSDDYTFGGWTETGTGKFTEELNYVVGVETEQTLYAYWKRQTKDGLTWSLIGEDITIIGCISSATEIIVPSTIAGYSVTSIGNSAFSGCNSLTNIEIPTSVKSIGNRTFENCSLLNKIEIPNSVLSIGEYAFYNCYSIASIIIGEGVTSIGKRAFSGCSNVTEIYFNATNCSGFNNESYVFYGVGGGSEGVTLTFGEKVVSVPENMFFHKSFYGEADIVTIVFEENSICEKIGEFAFCNLTTLVSVKLPETLTGIYSQAFYQCRSLESITLNKNISWIGYMAFDNCDSLIKVNYTGTIDQWVQIRFGDTRGNPLSKARNLYINNELVTEAIITAATQINDNAFSGCSSLTSITIGNSVTSIGNYAFSGCSSLKSIFYCGTAEDWDKITIGSSNSSLTSATRYYYVENESDLPADNGNYWHYVDGVPTVWTKD